jgi:hypothetical protein
LVVVELAKIELLAPAAVSRLALCLTRLIPSTITFAPAFFAPDKAIARNR